LGIGTSDDALFVLDIHHVGKFFTGAHQHNVFWEMPFRNSHVSSGAKALNTEGCPQNLPASDKYTCRGSKIVADLYKREYNGLPDRDVKTIRDLIHYQYAKIIARSALHAPDGTAAKANHYGFIKQTFRELDKKLFTYLRTSPSFPLSRLLNL
jgi:hypothetical protein